MNRKKALELNLPTYSTGKKCKNGHKSARYTKTYACVECTRQHNQAYQETYYETHKEERKQYQKQYYEDNKICLKTLRQRNKQC